MRGKRSLAVVVTAVALGLALLPSASSATASWAQVGGTITAAGSSSFGIATSMSGDGTRIAVGDRAVNTYEGTVRVYDDVAGTWTQVGGTIVGPESNAEFGGAVDLSADGSRLAVLAGRRSAGGADSGSVRIYQLVAGTWTQVGQEINGTRSYAYTASLALNADGSRIVVGQTGPGAKGAARVFELVSGTWTQVGNTLEGVNSFPDGDFFGWSVGIDAGGSRIIVGARGNGSSATLPGKAIVYDLVGTTWTQVGGEIVGDAPNDRYGTTVSISADGSRVLVAAERSTGGAGFGYVRAFDLDGGTWTQVGADIVGSAGAIAADGVRVGVRGNRAAPSDPKVGAVYDLLGGVWTQIGADIAGTAGVQSWGSIAISGLGYRIVDGQYGAAGGGNVLVFEQTRPQATISFDTEGGAAGPAPVTGLERSVITLPTDTPVRSGYTFAGWNTLADGLGTMFQPGDEVILLSVTLHAVWIAGGPIGPNFTG